MNSILRVATLLAVSGLLLGASPVGAPVHEVPELDRELERRLVVSSRYKVSANESLRSVAHLLYGHRTWWVKLRQQNPELFGRDPDEPLPVGTVIRYRAPKIGAVYRVRPHDWLLRIVQWKYGATDQWENIYRKNSRQIENPNLIYPGDELSLDVDGTVRQAGSGKVIVAGIGGEVPGGGGVESTLSQLEAPLAQLGAQMAEYQRLPNLPNLDGVMVRQLASLPPTESSETSELVFWLGFLVGVLAILGAPFGMWTVRKRKLVDVVFDSSLVHRDEGEIRAKTGYLLISEQKKKNSGENC